MYYYCFHILVILVSPVCYATLYRWARDGFESFWISAHIHIFLLLFFKLFFFHFCNNFSVFHYPSASFPLSAESLSQKNGFECCPVIWLELASTIVWEGSSLTHTYTHTKNNTFFFADFKANFTIFKQLCIITMWVVYVNFAYTHSPLLIYRIIWFVCVCVCLPPREWQMCSKKQSNRSNPNLIFCSVL